MLWYICYGTVFVEINLLTSYLFSKQSLKTEGGHNDYISPFSGHLGHNMVSEMIILWPEIIIVTTVRFLFGFTANGNRSFNSHTFPVVSQPI